MNHRYCLSLLLFLSLFLIPTSIVLAEPEPGNWGLPVALTDHNTKVTFEVDSTWHTVVGATLGVSGGLRLSDAQDFSSVTGEIRFPVGKFDTDNSRRDEKMRTVMAAESFPAVIFVVNGLGGTCHPDEIKPELPCKGSVKGKLRIRDKEQALEIPCTIAKLAEGFEITGGTTIRWRDFGVEDPSIFVAKLAEEVRIKFTLTLYNQSSKQD